MHHLCESVISPMPFVECPLIYLVFQATNEGVNDSFQFSYTNVRETDLVAIMPSHLDILFDQISFQSTLKVLDHNDQKPIWEDFPFYVPQDESIPIQIDEVRQ